MEFRELKSEDIDKYKEILTGYETNSEASFANMYAWRNVMNTKICFEDNNCFFIYIKRNGEDACCFPKGDNSVYAIEKLISYFKSINKPMIMESVTEEEVNIITSNFKNITVKEDIDLFDYVYCGEKLRTLSGKKLHSKRNHINKFKTLYPDYKYVSLDKNNIDLCLEYSKKWLLNKYHDTNSSDYLNEYSSINEFLNNFDKFQLSGGIILIDNEIQAFTIGEKLNTNTCVIHVEKANTEFEGIYPAINNFYLNDKWRDIEFVNREEDMGIEGIRKAKKSYYPDKMIKKYTIRFN